MKLLYVHQYFKTPQEGGSLRSYYLAKGLVAAGHDVVMITAHNRNKKVECTIDGIQVIYLPVAYANIMPFKLRVLSFLKFSVWAIFESMQQQKIDLCYVMTTPLTTGIVALFNRYFMRRPYVFEVGDLWPKVPIEMGIITGRLSQFLLRWMERTFYRNAKGLIGLSPPITAHISHLAPAIPVTTLYNIANCVDFQSADKNPTLVDKYGVADHFVMSYTGTFGLANDLRQIVDWAEAITNLPVKIILVGAGAEHAEIRSLIAKKGLKNIQVFDAMDKAGIHEVVNVSDALLVSFANFTTLHTGSPNKFFDALAAGKLVITNFGGWVGDLIKAEQCGIVVKNTSELRSQLSPFLRSSEMLSDYQKRSRQLAEAKFDLPIISGQQIEFVERMVGK